MNSLFDEARAALHAIWMRRWIALAIAWGLCLAGWLVVSQMPNSYESRARIFVQLRQILPTDGVASAQQQQRDIDRIRQTLTSAVNLEKVVRGTDMVKTVSSNQDIADRIAGLQKAIKLTAQQDNLFEITVTAPSGKLAQQIAQKLIDVFVEENLADNRDASGQSLRFLDQQLEVRQKALQEAEAKKADFAARYLGSLPGTGSLNDRIGAARTQLAQVQSDLAAAQSGLSAVNGQMAGTPMNVAGAGGAVTGPARARLQAIQGQLAEGRARGWTDSHPDMIALNSQLAQAQVAARAEPAVGAAGASNPLYLSLKSMQADKAATVAALTQRKSQIEDDLAQFEDKMAQSPGVAAEQGQIDREYQVLKDQYDKLLSDREQVRIRSQAQTETDAVKFDVVDPPTLARAPTKPNRPLLLAAVLIAGMGAGVAGAFGLDKLTTTFPTAARLEKVSGMPVIGSIGEVLSAGEIALRRRKLRLFMGATAGLTVAFVGLLGLEMVQRGMGA